MTEVQHVDPYLTPRRALDLQICVGEPKVGARRFWTTTEISTLRKHYPTVGLAGCLPLLPGRPAGSIYQKAGQLGLKSPATQRERAPRRKYPQSDHVDEAIRRLYPRATGRGQVNAIGAKVGRPIYWVKKRAIELGLVAHRFKEPRWDDREIQIITSRIHQGLPAVRRALKAEGFQRTQTAIKVRLIRLKISMRQDDDPDLYSARSVGELMGVDGTTVNHWITAGLLAASRDKKAEKATWQITRKAIRNFIIQHTWKVDIRKVQRDWFVELLANPR